MHSEIEQNKQGNCPKCGMKLVPKKDLKENNSHSSHHNTETDSYLPLYIIVGLISLVTVVLAIKTGTEGQFMWTSVMNNFMAGFFLVFSGFKLLDIKGFAEGYSTYDLLAKRFFGYGYIYPFLELILGMLYVTQVASPMLHIVTFILMSFSGIGVAIKLLKHEQFQCACLGTFLKVPLTKITLVEDFGMAIMALLMVVA